MSVINTVLEPECAAEFPGGKIYYLETDKFKTNSIHIYLDSDITAENATMNALLPLVMRRGCKSFPTLRDISRRLEEMYGATFNCSVSKKGERHVILFYIEYVNDRYTTGNTQLFMEAFDLLGEILLHPVIKEGAFNREYLRQEKTNLENLIRGRINNKVQYAVERCLEEMCDNEPYAIYEYGTVSDFERIDEKGLYRHYRSVLETWPISVFIVGKANDRQLSYVESILRSITPRRPVAYGDVSIVKKVNKVRHVGEKHQIKQGKLSLGYRTNTGPVDDDYYALLVYNGVLGGGIHSKLFQNVREKEGLAYYVFSRLEKFKGLMVAGGGIEPENRARAESVIKEQVEEMAKGNITDYEHNAAIKAIETGIKSLRDSHLQTVDFYMGQYVCGGRDSFGKLIQQVKQVEIEDVVRVANKVKLDTVYFLSPE